MYYNTIAMKRVINEFIFDMFRQIVGWSKPREGVIFPTEYTKKKMTEYGIDITMLEDVFRHGEKKKHKIVRKYTNATAGLYFKALKSKRTDKENRYVITTCWKNKR